MGTMADGVELVRLEKAEDGGGKEERILVSVRVRPLNVKEIEKNDPGDWECINSTTIIYKQSLPERSVYPAAYTFDRVFGSKSGTRNVYDEGAKEVALSVVSGINASIFAYGQTSSGKTYTMSGITEYAIEDIYEYIKRHEERTFVLKFSAMEIYNEAVRDLLSTDSTPLRLLDDPERGTVVDKLTEETLRDKSHLKELLAICAAQRQVGETALNELSSRSHQILRLTIESTAKEFMGRESSSTLFAAVNFVDLAGSERASQVSSAGNRLKEGCHINRSLLTLGTVIRKLSKGRTGHIPYRDSKLTRILQPFLGGNARTAIICTMSPARSHIEQSRNTLLFASCAKQVVTNAQVNVVMSDKALVKHLQRELARMENELKHPGISTCTQHSEVLRERDAQIKKMEREMKELMQQRDLAQSRLDDLLRVVAEDQVSRHWEVSSQSSVSHPRSECEDALSVCGMSGVVYQIPDFNPSRFEAPGELSKYNYQLEPSDKLNSPWRSTSSPNLNEQIMHHGIREIAEGTYEDSEDHCKEVQCIEVHAVSTSRWNEFDQLNDQSNGLLQDTDERKLVRFTPKSVGNAAHLRHQSVNFETSKSENSQQDLMNSEDMALTKSNSCKASLENNSGFSSLNYDEKNTTPSVEELDSSYMAKTEDIKTVHKETDSDESTLLGIDDVADNHCQKQLSSDEVTQQTQLESDGAVEKQKDAGIAAMPCSLESPLQGHLEFERKQLELIQLWQACHVPLAHRSCFFLLFKGDPADSFYMEVEFRRLSFLRNTFTHGNAGDIVAEDGHRFSLSSSLRYLRWEREMLWKQMEKILSPEEREMLYAKWGINLNSKQRKMQLAQRLWTQTDIDHAKESALVVAKVIGFVPQGEAMKEMFGLCFTPQPIHMQKRAFGWL